jgi:hypothetical protein
MTRQSLALAAFLGLALTSQTAPAFAQMTGSQGEYGRDIASMCRAAGVNAQGAMQTIRISVAGTQDQRQIEQTVLNECRTNYRLNNCAIVSCRP